MKFFTLIFLSLSILTTSNLHAEEAVVADKMNGKKIYDNLCAYCHKLGDENSLVGAFTLQDISSRRTDAWLSEWLKSPGNFAKVNAEAKELIDDENAILVMPEFPAMQDDKKRRDVIEYLKTL